MTHIVVGVDGSETGGRALQWALREATLRQQPVVAVLAWGFLDQHHATNTEPFDPSYDHADAVAALDVFVIQAVGSDAAAHVERQVVCDLPARALLDASADASLLVVGVRGLGGFRDLLLGSVSQQALHHATCPIAIVRSDGATRHNGSKERIVVGTDGSETARRALRWAIEEARVRGASLEVVHSWHAPDVGGYPYGSASFDMAPFEAAARQTLDAAVAEEDASGLAEPPQRLLVMGSAAQAILKSAEGADLVVMGSRGLGGFKELLLGSVSHQVAQHADCPTVIVPPES